MPNSSALKFRKRSTDEKRRGREKGWSDKQGFADIPKGGRGGGGSEDATARHNK